MTKARAVTTDACGGKEGAKALSVDEAIRFIAAQVHPIGVTEVLALRPALGRYLAQDISSPIDVPGHTNSAVDGYAIRHADLSNTGKAALRLIGTSWAGRPYSGKVHTGECVRIMTGAAVPDGADTVVMQEQTEREQDTVRVNMELRLGDNVRAAGEDIARGAVVLRAGRQILPAELGLLASVGLAEVPVFRRLRVAFFSTGDEICSAGQTLALGQIYDSNRYTLYGMLTRLGVEIIDLGVVPDEREAVTQAFTDAARRADAIITSGGVSVGEADYVKETLAALGQIGFWQISMKPGRPFAFGRVRDAVFFGLPGNPVSVMVTYYQFVEPALRRLMGQSDAAPRASFRVRCAARLKKRPGRSEFQRGILERGADGELTVRATGEQGSGILTSMSTGDCFIVLPKDGGSVEAGSWVEVQPFYGLI
jgi:molybdopterin molybdotransferase